jgi:hypothetical protein
MIREETTRWSIWVFKAGKFYYIDEKKKYKCGCFTAQFGMDGVSSLNITFKVSAPLHLETQV